MNQKLKVIYTTPILEYPPAGGPQLRIKNSILALNTVSELHLLTQCSIETMGGQDAENYYRQFSESFLNLTTLFQSKSKFYRFLLRLKCKLLLQSENDTYAYNIVRYAREKKINIIWFGYGNISFDLIRKIRKIAPWLKLVCDTDSVWSRFILRELPFVDSIQKRNEIEEKGRRKEWEEKNLVNICDITTAVSNIDAQYYKKLCNDDNKIQIFSNVIDSSEYLDQSLRKSEKRPPTIFLGGTFGHYSSPMDAAARWVIEEVLPIVHKSIPNARLLIVGKGSDGGFNNAEDGSVVVTGKVKSVLPYLMNSDVAIVPLKFESGTRFKILEAGICRVPIVSTTLGAEGIPVRNNEDIVIADSGSEFANGILRCLKDQKFSQHISNNCFNLVYSNFRLPNLIEEAKIILSNLNKLG